jgi:predicted lipoprotein with Yx(FWY)xxD motif
VQRTPVVALASVLLAALLAGCGSSNKTSSSAASAPPSSTATSSAAATSTASATPAVLITTKHTKLGTILGAGPKKLTVYLFEADKGQSSNCSGACPSTWPPVSGQPHATGATVASKLGTISRADGTAQVTYNGHPLYFYAKDVKDGDAGDTYGQGLKSFGAGWYVLKPSGSKLDTS